jgi:hypothetical protein
MNRAEEATIAALAERIPMNASTGRRTRPMLASCAAVAVAALVGGCGDDDENEPATFAITATAEGVKKKVLEFPSTVKSGLVTMTLTNNDKVPRSARIVRLLGDHTVDDFRDAVEKEGAPIPEWIQDGGGVSTVLPRGAVSVTQVLAPGRYAIADDASEPGEDGKSFADLGAKGEFTVTGPASDAELPARPATLTATDDGGGDEGEYGFEFKGLKAGPNMVRFENTGTQLHHALLFPIVRGKTIKDAEAALTADRPLKRPSPVDSGAAISTQIIDGGIAQNLLIYLQPETNYAVICFIQDRKGGKPHVAKGMIEELRVGRFDYE